jgi:uncharacterized protein YqgV (UPF0045/DUF77 family)
MSTEIEGDWDEVMKVVKEATFVLANKYRSPCLMLYFPQEFKNTI